MVEATGNLNNFIPLKKVYHMPLDKICIHLCKELGKRFNKDNIDKIENPNILALHSSDRRTSNTLTLWDMVKVNLKGNIEEINVGNGEIVDCIGCPYKTCKHYGSRVNVFMGE